jgi:soluble lytic murein transglycosylase-like protein/TolA-binding protein
MNRNPRNPFLTRLQRSRGILGAILTLAFLGLVLLLSLPKSLTAADDNDELLKLLRATESQEAASQVLGFYRYPSPETMKDQQSLWPIYSFLWAEIYRLRGDSAQARKILQSLGEWSAQNPYDDDWGGSGLAVVALWRWLSLANLNADVTLEEKENLLAKISKFWRDQPRLGRGMFINLPWLLALPQLKENLLRQTSFLARGLNNKSAAQRFFIEYLSVATTGQLTEAEQELLKEATSEGILSMPKIALSLGARLQQLGDFNGASHWLSKAMATGKSQVRAEASLSLAKLRRIDEKKPERCLTPKVQQLLSTAINESTDPEVIQEALLHRVKVAIREGCTKDYARFQKDLQQILKDFPQGRIADDALDRLASYYLDQYSDTDNLQDLIAAQKLFKQLRDNFPNREEHIDFSWFKPAMALYATKNPEKATALLKELEEARANGPLHLAAVFWLGRMAAEAGKEHEARSYFETIIRECPYNYYATRARMHLHLGNQAARQFGPDDKTLEELNANFQRSRDQRPFLIEKSPYHLRLQAATRSGLYYWSLRSYIDFRLKEFPSRRLETIPLEKLDQANRLPHVALLLALRQDALAAAETPPDPRNRLAVAGSLSEFKSQDWPLGDWPMVFCISSATDRPYDVMSKIQNDPGYLAIAYPKTFGRLIAEHSNPKVPGALLYAVSHESAFEPTFLSPAAAQGLFKFTPKTFDVLDERYHVLRKRKKSSREEFLFNPEDSFYLGALWFQKELMPSQDNNLLWALMEHNAGKAAVEEWKRKWQRRGRIGDYEFMLETVRFPETQSFVRSVANTYWIVSAAGLY